MHSRENGSNSVLFSTVASLTEKETLSYMLSCGICFTKSHFYTSNFRQHFGHITCSIVLAINQLSHS